MPDVGPVIAASVQGFFADARHRAELKRLRALGLHWPEGAASRASAEGCAAAVGHHRGADRYAARHDREQAAERLHALGAKVSGSVSKKTSYRDRRRGAWLQAHARRRNSVSPVLDERGPGATAGAQMSALGARRAVGLGVVAAAGFGASLSEILLDLGGLQQIVLIGAELLVSPPAERPGP